MTGDGKPDVGLIGVGHIGGEVCRHLLGRGKRVCVFDLNKPALRSAEDMGAVTAGSVGELGAHAKYILLSLPDSDAVEAVVLSPGGLCSSMPPGSLVIDTSSSRPASTRMLASELSKRGIRLLDAPVSGGVLRAKAADLAVMVGGRKEDFDEVADIVGCFASKAFYVGGTSTGHLIKALNNLLSATTLVSASEALLLAIKGGIDPQRFIEVVNASSGRSNSTEVKFPNFILPRQFKDGFAATLMNKDLNVALEAAADLDFPVMVGSIVAQMWRTAIAHGLCGKDHTEFFAVWQEMLGANDQPESTPT